MDDIDNWWNFQISAWFTYFQDTSKGFNTFPDVPNVFISRIVLRATELVPGAKATLARLRILICEHPYPVTAPAGGQPTLPGGEQGTPPGGGQGTPPGGGQGTPPGGGQGTPPGGGQGTPPGGGQGTLPGGDECIKFIPTPTGTEIIDICDDILMDLTFCVKNVKKVTVKIISTGGAEFTETVSFHVDECHLWYFRLFELVIICSLLIRFLLGSSLRRNKLN